MENQINVGVQRQSYEPFEQADSEAENSGAEASLADDSAGANTRGNPDIVSLQVEGESVSEVPPEIVATNNMLNRYSIGDTVILGRPDYTFNTLNNPEVLAESVFAERNSRSDAAGSTKSTRGYWLNVAVACNSKTRCNSDRLYSCPRAAN
jgi:hypothetical protein